MIGDSKQEAQLWLGVADHTAP